MSSLASPIDRLCELGGSLWVDGCSLCYCIPARNPEARQVVTELRPDREAIVAMLQDQASKAPSLEEVMSMLPLSVRLLRYRPREAPFVVAPPVTAVTNAGCFYRAYLADLRWRLGHPRLHAAPPLPDILGKLADAGLELELYDRR